MNIVCPTVLALDPHGYREQLERVEPITDRIQVDIADGDFAKNKTVIPPQLYWEKHQKVDVHVMYTYPDDHLETLIALKPHMIILHAESLGNLSNMFTKIQNAGIKAGLAILPDTSVASVEAFIKQVDHVLIFGGSLGFFGGNADLEMLEKVDQIKEISPEIEIGWDGGANEKNARDIFDAGVDVLNVGSYIQRAQDPKAAYAILNEIAIEAN